MGVLDSASKPAAAGPGRDSRLRRLGGWLDDRFGLSALAYPVPEHANGLAYTLGGITLGCFVLLVLTGIYLTQVYNPAPAAAHASVVHISREPFGSVVRSLHFWLATLFMATLVLHVLRTFVTASFKRPREGTWLTGVALFALAGGLLFTGTMLKWDQEAFEAFGHNVEISDLLGVLGFWLSPQFSDSVALLTRTYITHVSLLPLLVAALVGVHLLLIKRHRISPIPWGSAEEVERRERAEPQGPFTAHLGRLFSWTLIVFGIALLLAAINPVGIGPEGVEGIEITKPPWYFLWLYPFENWFGLKPLIVVPALLLAGLAALPFLDRSPERDPRRRRPWVALGAVVLLAWLGLTLYGVFTQPVSHVGG